VEHPPSLPRFLFERLWTVLVAFTIVLIIGSVGYLIFTDDYSFSDAIYMTVITIGTIGYGEVEPLDTVGRMWTIVVIIMGYTAFIYGSAMLTTMFIARELAGFAKFRRRDKMLDHLRDHVIVAGYGRVGRAAVPTMVRTKRGCAVIEMDEDKLDDIEAVGAVSVSGDTRTEAALLEAGVEHARSLVAALDDPDNLIVTLTARALNSDLQIVTRLNDPSWRDRLQRAGANRVVAVYDSAGIGLAAGALGHDVFSVLDLPELGMRTEEITVEHGSSAVGGDLATLSRAVPQAMVLGVRTDEGVSRWYEVRDPLEPGDVVVALGSHDTLQQLAAMLVATDAPAGDQR
jgi:voltage-gated potassium channel